MQYNSFESALAAAQDMNKLLGQPPAYVVKMAGEPNYYTVIRTWGTPTAHCRAIAAWSAR